MNTVGITVCTKNYLEMAQEASLRFSKHTNISSEIILVDSKEESHLAKLRLNKKCWFFDSDLWFVRDVVLPELIDGIMYATPVNPSDKDWKIICEWASRENCDPLLWFSGGLYGYNWFNNAILGGAAFNHMHKYKICDRDEESLNVACQKTKTNVVLLPSSYNWHPVCGEEGYGFYPEGGPYAIHAGGIPSNEKFNYLKKHCNEL